MLASPMHFNVHQDNTFLDQQVKKLLTKLVKKLLLKMTVSNKREKLLNKNA